MLPQCIRESLEAQLGTSIEPQRAVSGGDISRAVQVQAGEQQYLVKWRKHSPASFWAAEADGLHRLRAAAALAVPTVIAFDDHEDYGWIALEWFEARGRYQAAELGAGLARLHQHTAAQFGLERDNFIGRLPQFNAQAASWPEFWAQQRLVPQQKMARERGRMHGQRERLFEQLIERLPRLLDHQPEPVLLHGDLWAGNVITAPDGSPALIDPAVSYGDRETDLAFAALFGGFGAEFEHAYQAVSPLPEGWQRRRSVYQLYWLLVHLNLFGESYGSSVDRIVREYATAAS